MQSKMDDEDYSPPLPPIPTIRIPGPDPDPADEDSGIIAVYRDRLANGWHWRHPLDPPMDADARRFARLLLHRHMNGEQNIGGYAVRGYNGKVTDEEEEETAEHETLADFCARMKERTNGVETAKGRLVNGSAKGAKKQA